ncbi:uncharacterized protein PAC_04678 [Phialocephala subalpina]|uniref:F-box domain-containing protein n=1 Tax=Phialocephala subalpina TaxID=576137 RepID=A0A1L7WPU1_9HELO|nr:uncharacterized protein PAC_04678 [Phialocephala subalpina]
MASFLSLPLEIRNLIYSLVLISPTPLIAWSGMPLFELMDEPAHDPNGQLDPSSFSIDSYLADALPVERLAVRISLVNKQVSEEAAAIFWTKNTFRFLGKWLWGSVVEWLASIGDTNRGHLKSLEMTLMKWYSVQHVWQLHYPKGARTQLDATISYSGARRHNGKEKTYPRSLHLVLPDIEDEGELIGCVDNISPAVETVFRMLGRTRQELGQQTGQKMKISMMMPEDWYPGFRFSEFDVEYFDWYMSMDLPNVMERCRELHTASEGNQIEILWKGKMEEPNFEEYRSTLEELGWEIVDERHELATWWWTDELSCKNVYFSLRRRKIEGDIVASAPSIYSNEHYDLGPQWWNTPEGRRAQGIT